MDSVAKQQSLFVSKMRRRTRLVDDAIWILPLCVYARACVFPILLIIFFLEDAPLDDHHCSIAIDVVIVSS